jgi:RNA polymerase sigma factor (sigma-70 family)
MQVSSQPPPRENLLLLFAAFLNISRLHGDLNDGEWWIIDSFLRRSMLTNIDRATDWKVHQWIVFWHQQFREVEQSPARNHLAAYLQEVCYRASNLMMRKLDRGASGSQYTVTDCFQIAISSIDKVLECFDPKLSVQIEAYAYQVFKSKIRDDVHKSRETKLMSKWSLLRRIARGTLEEALQSQGFHRPQVERYLLLWQCYTVLNIPKAAIPSGQLQSPDEATWLRLTNLYNSERQNQLAQPSQEISRKTAEQWLETCAEASRSYLNPSINSLNRAPLGKDGAEIQDLLSAPHSGSLLEKMIEQEEEQIWKLRQKQIHQTLCEALERLGADTKALLNMYYGEDLRQVEIAKRLQIEQSTVARRLERARGNLLKYVAASIKETQHISLSRTLLKAMGGVVDEWLCNYFQLHSNF